MQSTLHRTLGVASALFISACVLPFLGSTETRASDFLDNFMNDAQKVIEKTQEQFDKQEEAEDTPDQDQPDQQPSSIATAKEVQSKLNQLGYDAGPVDGKPGQQTTEAIAAFQIDNDLAVDGKITPALVQALSDATAGSEGQAETATATSTPDPSSGTAAAKHDLGDSLKFAAPSPELHPFVVPAYQGLVRIGEPDSHGLNIQHLKNQMGSNELSTKQARLDELHAGTQQMLHLLGLQLLPDQLADLPHEVPGRSEPGVAAFLNLQLIAAHVVSDRRYDEYFCPGGDARCKRNESMTHDGMSYATSLSLNWGGLGADEFARRAAYKAFLESGQLYGLVGWADQMPRDLAFVFQVRMEEYDFAQQGFAVNFKPSYAYRNAYFRYIYRPKLPYEEPFAAPGEQTKNLQTYLKIAEGPAQALRERLKTFLYFAAKIEIQDAPKKLGERTDFYFNLASPVFEVYEDEALTMKVGEIRLDSAGPSTQEASAASEAGGAPGVNEEVQRLLNRLGYDAGAADGVIGSDTKRAIASFQIDHGLSIDGEVTPELLEALRNAASQ